MAKPASRIVRWLAVASTMGVLAVKPTPALAYRPFDGTDAAVADVHEVEIEFGPVGLLREGSQHTVITPAVVLNYGVVANWEVVLQGQGEFASSPSRGRTSIRDNGLFLKGVVRPGVLQGESGPSVATEFGALLPDLRTGGEQSNTGASLAGIVSDRWGWLTTHLNVQAALSREHEPDYFVSAIFEGPFDWAVRPVSEIFYEWDAAAGETRVSGLVGAIWRADENLSFDAGLREARNNDRPVTEIRLGFTIGFSPW